jgi:TonB family protein
MERKHQSATAGRPQDHTPQFPRFARWLSPDGTIGRIKREQDGSGMSEMWKRFEGQIINNSFALRQYLGGSKHSAVFLTEQPGRKGQKAAIKLIPAEPTTADLQLSRWAQAAKLSHPHILRYYQMGRCELADVALLFLVMEYAEENLAQVVPSRALSAAEAHDTIAPTVDALAYLHQEGFAHGRVKPANIMAVGNKIKLTSDGLWWMGESSIEISNSSPYDAPEKSISGFSPAGDAWSLGLTLVEALTTRLPAINGNGEVTLPPTLPAPYFDIAEQCLRRDPRERASMAQIVAQLQGPKPVQKERAEPLSLARFKPLLTPQRLIMPIMAIAALLVVVLTVPRLLRPRDENLQPILPAATDKSASPTPIEKPKAGVPAASTNSKTSSAPESPSPAELVSQGSRSPLPQHEILHEVVPSVPQSARDTIQGTVRVDVRVAVDSTGKIAKAKFESTGPSKYFARLAMQAAEGWKFAPAENNWREWLLRFEFQRSGTRVHPVQVSR